jgi:3-isopropylmalate/(R)-2-methylmalate dehydratase large subunit
VSSPEAAPRTLFEKIWSAHEVAGGEGLPTTLYVDLHLLHEVTSPQAFRELAQRGLPVRRPGQCLATMDHATPTTPGVTLASLATSDGEAAAQLSALARSCAEHGIPLLPLGDARQGIVHVIGPELGATQPGMTIVCGDSHTSTHGAFGALAFGIGTSEVGYVLATQCLLAARPRTFLLELAGRLPAGVAAKDLILAAIARFGVDAGTGSVLEYGGEAAASLNVEERMTICNMSIEAGARAGLFAPDEVTFAYLEGRPLAPRGEAWEAAVERWRRLPSDPGARFDRHERLDLTRLEPMITYGTHPGMAMPVGGAVPEAADQEPASFEKALRYMGFEPGERLLGKPIDVVFLGSCTNSRLSDLRAAASVLAGRKVAPNVRMLVVPGSQAVKRQAEAEGLARVFVEAGAEWREAGCSMCLAMNGDRLEAGQLAVSTTNRNFEGRQGPGGRTLLASPLTAAASAVRGAVADARELVR